MKYIRRVSKVKNDDTKGYIINSTNVEDKEKNTYSANIIDGLLGGTNWKNATINTEYLSGNFRYIQIGKLVIVNIFDIVVKKNITASEIVLASGLPESKGFNAFMLQGTDGSKYDNFRMVLAQDGTEIKSWYHNKTVTANMMYYGLLTYIAK